MKMRSIRTVTAAAALAAALAAPLARATGEVWDIDRTPLNGFGGLSSTWSLSAPGSAFAAWNVFGNDASPPVIYDMTPDAGSFGVEHAFVYETGTAGAFLTGGGNIYSFSGATRFEAYLQPSGTAGSGTRDVALRLETLGTALSAGSVTLDGIAPTTQAHIDVGALGGMGGTETEWVFVWKNVADTTPLMFAFGAIESSMSLSQAAMYVSPAAAVPEPHEWALMVAGLGMVGVAVRRRRTGRKSIG